MPSPLKPESWREALKFINRCPICSSLYDTNDAKLFSRNETATLVHLTCNKCSSYFVAMVLLMGQGVSSVGMITDLSFDDVKRLYNTQPFTTDEIIDAHEEMQTNTFIHSLIINS
jgi:hypothetical protein